MHITTKPTRAVEFKGLVADLRRNGRAHEPGCRRCEVLPCDVDPPRFLFDEIFVDMAAHAAHPDMPYHVAKSAAAWAWVEGHPVIERCTPLDKDNAGGSGA